MFVTDYYLFIYLPEMPQQKEALGSCSAEGICTGFHLAGLQAELQLRSTSDNILN